MELEGLTDLQKDLLKIAQRDLPREIPKVMRKVGNKARTEVARYARSRVIDDTGLYNKKWKRGKVFKGRNRDETVVRVINSAPHAHLLEYGHRQVMNPHKGKGNGRGVIPGKGIGREVGFVLGFHNLEKGMKNFEASGKFDDTLSDWLDDLLKAGKL